MPSEDAIDLVALAERAHAHVLDQTTRADEAAIKAGENAVKTATVLNGGSVVAILSLTGNLNRYHADALDYAKLKYAVGIYAIGVACAGVAFGTSFFVNSLQADGLRLHVLTYNPPFVNITIQSERLRRLSKAFRLKTFVLVAASYGAFIIASFKMLDIIGAVH